MAGGLVECLGDLPHDVAEIARRQGEPEFTTGNSRNVKQRGRSFQVVAHRSVNAFKSVFNLCQGVFAGLDSFKQEFNLTNHWCHWITQFMSRNGYEVITGGNRLGQLRQTAFCLL
jgi:hypothetical protein